MDLVQFCEGLYGLRGWLLGSGDDLLSYGLVKAQRLGFGCLEYELKLCNSSVSLYSQHFYGETGGGGERILESSGVADLL